VTITAHTSSPTPTIGNSNATAATGFLTCVFLDLFGAAVPEGRHQFMQCRIQNSDTDLALRITLNVLLRLVEVSAF